MFDVITFIYLKLYNLDMMNLDNFFKAKSVAIVGVSSNPEKVGHVIFRNFIDSKFNGKLYVVNPTVSEILGYKSYKSLKEIENKLDLVIIAVPANLVLDVIIDCGKKGIKDVIIISAGFEEVGDFKLRDKLLKLLQKYDIRVIGPNCLGTFDAYTKLDSLFLPQYRLTRPDKGGISFVCQSGAAGSALLDLASKEGYGFAKFISYGNAINVDEGDIIEYLGKDPQTKVICLYVEGVKHGSKFISVCKEVSKKKPIIAIKGGVSEAGSLATLSHTGSLAGNAVVYDGVFRQCGIIRAVHLEDMFNYAGILEKCIAPLGKNVQVITNGGGYGILCTDAIVENNLKMAKMDVNVLKKLAKQMPPIVIMKNPMDLVGDANTERYKIALEAALNDKNVDIILLVLLYQTPLLTPDVINVVTELNNEKKKPIVVVSTGGQFTELLKHSLQETGVPCYTFPEQAAGAIKVLCDYYIN